MLTRVFFFQIIMLKQIYASSNTLSRFHCQEINLQSILIAGEIEFISTKIIRNLADLNIS